ncbi:MAG: response regulator [Cyanobacteria bacterium J06635_15]
MPDSERLLEFANQLFDTYTGKALSNVQMHVLAEALVTGFRPKTYDQIAAEIGYSSTYIKTVVARDLWKSFSEIAKRRVTRRDMRRFLLEQLQANDTSQLSGIETSLKTGATAAGMSTPNDAALDDTFASSAGSPSSAPCILVVDDQPHSLALLTEVLEHEKYEVWPATSGADALKKAGMLLPDLILLDVNMPGMNGYEVCRQLKADPRTQLIPVIFVSALDESCDKVQGFSVGGTDYITKPIDTLETLVRVDHQIQLGATQAQLSRLRDNEQLQDSNEPSATPQNTSSGRGASDAKASIMVVDDDPRNLSLLVHLLKEEGYEVWQAATGAEALRFAPKILPDLILLDINLPDIGGYDVCHQLKMNDVTKLIPVIFVSALNETWDKVKGFAFGGSDYVTKPLEILELNCRIRNQLLLWQQRSQLMRIRATEDSI